MTTRTFRILRFNKAEDIPSTKANPDTALESAGKTKAKKTSSKHPTSTKAIPQPVSLTPSGGELKQTTQKKSEVMQASISVIEENISKEEVADPIAKKKILPPIPNRTPAEAYYIATKYNYQRQSRNFFRWISPETLDWISEQMKTCTGRVADNLAVNKCQLVIHPKLVASFCEDLIKALRANPAIVIPTWIVLTDNKLTIMAKLHKLYEIGWTADVIPERRKGIKVHFIKIYILGQLLESGISHN